MGETPSMYPNLSDQTQSRLNKINQIKDSFIPEIREKATMSKRLGNYTAAFDYFDKAVIVLSAMCGGISIAFFSSVIGTSVEIASTSFRFALPVTTGIIKKLLETTWNKKEKHNKTVIQTRSKLNSIETIISQASNRF